MLCLSHCFNKGQFCVYRTALYTLLSGLTLSKFTFSHHESSFQFICDWFWILIVSLGGVFGSHSSWQFSNIFLTPSRSCLDAGLLVCSPSLPDAAALWQSGQCTLRPFFRVSVHMSGRGCSLRARGNSISQGCHLAQCQELPPCHPASPESRMTVRLFSASATILSSSSVFLSLGSRCLPSPRGKMLLEISSTPQSWWPHLHPCCPWASVGERRWAWRQSTDFLVPCSKNPSLSSLRVEFFFILFFLLIFKNESIVDFQCWVSFRCTAE